MFKLTAILIAILLQFPISYYETTVKPDASMRDLGAVNVTVYALQNGQFVAQCVTAQITKYVVWVYPKRASMYRVENAPFWSMLSERELHQQAC